LIIRINPADKFFAEFIRKYAKNYKVIANNSEKRLLYHDQEYYKLGLGNPVPISAEHGQGLADLYDEIAEKIDIEED
jgi:GTPase